MPQSLPHNEYEETPLARALWLINKLDGDPNSGRCICPAHDDENPSLDISLDSFSPKGAPLFVCRAGCSQDAIISALRARGRWPIPGSVPPAAGGTIRTYRSPEERLAFARKVYRGVKLQKWQRSLAKDYFQARGINSVPGNLLVTLPWKRGDAPESRLLALSDEPGLVFRVRDRDNKFKGIHVIWLNADLTDKREAEPQRQLYGPIKGGYVQFGEPDAAQPLLLAEGVESVLAPLQLTELPCGYAGCGNNTADIDMPPHGEVIICADNGAAGQGCRRLLRVECTTATLSANCSGAC